MMQKITRISWKGIIDLITIVAMIGCWVSTDTVKGHRGQFRNEQDIADTFSWGTLHSILSIIFTALIIIHIWQHWKFIKAIIKKNLYSKNIVTTLNFVLFAVTVTSFLLYLTGFSRPKGEFHGTVANIFLIAGCVHLLLNFDKLLAMFGVALFREGSWLHNCVSKYSSPRVVSVLSSIFGRENRINK
jgi:hydrogenase/urease accessory protein HupE